MLIFVSDIIFYIYKILSCHKCRASADFFAISPDGLSWCIAQEIICTDHIEFEFLTIDWSDVCWYDDREL